MTTFWIVIGVAVAIAIVAIVFFWYQNQRARVSMRRVDRSKLRNLDEDGWDDW
ncbi:hypothetical protein [Salinisphaera sp. LB1]|uniref:hypothetical protein n=1 Tax=Salinisphaera sp. LB1 TaxID=2183911 RepID=UPI000D7DD9E1|nr:hypothetical protein [Salinisphaera sp. LB1]AWN15491.1 hypothetical protein SALB1_1288 [Salinisphaera sp. LB1]